MSDEPTHWTGLCDPDGNGEELDLDELKVLLAAQGLHVVSAADKAVLDAMRVAAIAVYRDGRRLFLHEHQEHDACVAELARREQKP